MKHRVVVTGMGIVSPIGNTVSEAFDNSINGISGIEDITSIEVEGLKVKIAGQVKNFDGLKYMSKRDLRRQDLFSQYAVYAANEAYTDAGLTTETIDSTRLGAIVGTGIGGIDTFSRDLNKAFSGGINKIPPMFIPMVIPNMAAGNVAISLKAENHVTAVATACAAGTHAIGDAYRHILHGYADVMVAGGSEAAVNANALSGFSALGALSNHEDAQKASCPFDAKRNGFVLSEGAGILILESLEHALKRNATIHAEIIGYGSTSDAYHITAPSGDGARRAIQEAIDDAKILPKDVDYINAHGTSTPLNDQFETQAIKSVFKEEAYNVAISSTKSVHGHALGATGGIEAILTIMTLKEGIIPPTINLENGDPDCDLDYVPNNARKSDVEIAMSNSLGFGGHNAVVVFKKWSKI